MMPRTPSTAGHASHILTSCDECRARKLRCSGEATGCARCLADGIACHYSPRKQMGRPRKRRHDGFPSDENSVSSDSTVLAPRSPHATGFDNSHVGPAVAQVPGLENSYATETEHNGTDQAALFNFDFSQDFTMDPLVEYSELFSAQQLSSPYDSVFSHPPVPVYHALDPAAETSDFNEPARPSLPCRCLGKLYMALAAFQTTPAASFPLSLAPLKKASKLAKDVVKCSYCAEDSNSAIQNSMLLGTLMNLVISEYRRLVDHIDERAATEVRIPIRMGDNSPGSAHLHTGLPDCPMGIDVEISGQEWQSLARKVIVKDLYGTPDEQGLSTTIREMRERQVRWHSHAAIHQAPHKLGEGVPNSEQGGGCVCVQVTFIDGLQASLNSLSMTLGHDSNAS